jgi:hypothetical protein
MCGGSSQLKAKQLHCTLQRNSYGLPSGPEESGMSPKKNPQAVQRVLPTTHISASGDFVPILHILS